MSQHKVWFITGASRGFGRIWAEAALERGDKVAATARDPGALGDLVERYGASALALRLDVTKPDEARAAITAAHERFGRLDVIVSNAGYGYMGAVEEMALADLRANFETNVFGTVSVIQAALPILRAQKRGHILTLSSVGGVLSFPTGGGYTATKFAVEALSEALAGEVASLGIHVTILEPGRFNTEFGASSTLAAPLAEYDAVRAAVRAGFRPELAGDPRATPKALFDLVDAERPPLRLILGSKSLPMFERAYAQRLETWRAWTAVSSSAQGSEPSAPTS